MCSRVWPFTLDLQRSGDVITTASGAPSRPLRRGVYLRISPPRLAIFAALLIGSWVAIWLCTRAHASVSLKRMSVTAATQPVVHASSQSVTPHAAPWGELEVTPIQLAPPIDAAERFALVDTGTWYFRDCTPAQLAQILQTRGCPTISGKACSSRAAPRCRSTAWWPGRNRRWCCAFERCAHGLYRILAADPHNPQAEPFRHRLGTDWFAGSGLPEDVVSVARRLVYRRGEMEAFVDVSAIGPYLKSEAERAALIARSVRSRPCWCGCMCGRKATLTRWWRIGGTAGASGRSDRFSSRSARCRGEGAISVAQLMPQFARGAGLHVSAP